ncbi:NADPH-dependent FMN reductase [Novipirellula artificiosorum]|uniref:NADPH azoreductase n=1 Tax=Novipirellula artificiosorum TaxID=2528016 RepID=A0A5C6E089_9BACT|nr:NAD(P)H-dependent oxidoreductase [Novipirellula artificiosorum]TWU42318.1 NADPH azoreductase [Novipirellula artificiosorum]
MFVVLSASLHPDSRSRILAHACAEALRTSGREVTLFDLAVTPLPPCDGAAAYADENVQRLSSLIENADAIFVASPVYNFDLNAAAKNAVELTGQAWTGKIVSLMLAAGGQGSYMSAMGFANSLMLDFRCLIVPRFIYATGDAFEGKSLADVDISNRIEVLVNETTKLADAMKLIG